MKLEAGTHKSATTHIGETQRLWLADAWKWRGKIRCRYSIVCAAGHYNRENPV